MKENSFEDHVFSIKNFEDYRGLDLSKKDLKSVPLDILMTANFDSSTKWPNKEKLPANFDPDITLENGKNPGLCLRKLHEQGITGKEINVAIIDQKLDQNHGEYRDNMVNYEELGESANEEISMHGPAVASLLVGKNCGVAPEAKLHYKVAPCGDNCNWKYQSESLNKIIDFNNSVEDKDKIRVVSCSLGYPNPDFKGNLNNWIEAIEKAKSSGIIFIDSNTFFDLNFVGGGSFEDKNNIDKYNKWLYLKENDESALSAKNRIIVPSDYRTFASSWNKTDANGSDEYGFDGRGGVSWAIPYLAGLCSLMLQINNNLKMEEMVNIIYSTASVNKKGLKIINPKGIIESVKNSVKLVH